MRRPTGWALVLAAAAWLLIPSCAYYNTYYLARKYYLKGTEGRPYVINNSRTAGQSAQNFRKSIDYSKKVIGQYPKSKWVDDAYLLWARALLGSQDPRETTRMLEEFDTRYPDSPIRTEATFYLGLGYLESHKYARALERFDQFLADAPRHDLVPYVQLERARTLMALDRYAEAAEAASAALKGEEDFGLVTDALNARAEARFAAKDYEGARTDFNALGARARSDDERFELLLREADCLEAARSFDRELALLRDALSHEQEPARVDTTRSNQIRVVTGGAALGVADRYGRLTLRIGTVHLLEGRLDDAVAAYQRVVEDYARKTLGAEAQYRIGYAYETVGDDFDRARTEYQHVRDLSAGGPFGQQAAQRLANLDRIAQFRGAGGDTVAVQAEKGFLVAEQYLLQLDKPERALEEYRRIADEFEGTPHAAKAITAQAWVLSRKLGRRAEADSLLWVVVHDYPRTEAQLAARDYLEEEGVTVPPELIQPPEKPQPVIVAPDTLAETPLAPGPATGTTGDIERAEAMREAIFGVRPGAGTQRLAVHDSAAAAIGDSLARLGAPSGGVMMPSDSTRRVSAAADSTLRGIVPPADTTVTPAPPDTAGAKPASGGTRAAVRDSVPAAPADTSGVAR